MGPATSLRGLPKRTFACAAGLVTLALIASLAAAPGVSSAVVTETWQAKIGVGGINGTATIRAYTSGTGFIAIRLAALRPTTTLPIILSKGTCATAGSTIAKLAPVRTTRSGGATRTSVLPAAQMTALELASMGSGRIAIRVGSRTTGGVRCGVFAITTVTVGIVIPASWTRDRAAFQAALSGPGYNAHMLFSRDVVTERTDVRTLIHEGIKVLLLCPQDGSGAATAAEAAAAGVTVISYGRLILDTASVDYLVDFDGRAVGAAQAQFLIDAAGATRGNNLYLYAGAASDSNSFVFLEGAWSKLQPRIADGTFVIRNSSKAVELQTNATLSHDQLAAVIGQITTNWDPTTARTLAVGNLAAVSPTDKGMAFILGPNDATARAIADVFRADPQVSKYQITGQDAERASVQYIIEGKQGMTVLKDARTRVAAALAAAAVFVEGGTPPSDRTYDNGRIDVPAVQLPIVAVTLDNLQSAVIESGYYAAGDFTGTWPGKP